MPKDKSKYNAVKPSKRTDRDHVALAAHQAQADGINTRTGKLLDIIARQQQGKPFFRPDARTIEALVTEIECDYSAATLRGLEAKFGIAKHVLFRWIENSPELKQVMDEAQRYRVALGRDRLTTAASGESDEKIESGDLTVITSALRMYDGTAKSRTEVSGDGGGAIQVSVELIDKDE